MPHQVARDIIHAQRCSLGCVLPHFGQSNPEQANTEAANAAWHLFAVP
ncbi:MAG: hypothetical protein Q8K74_05190 [Candidatus Nitrotoga sp.]|nr:hypothetical protein [Candidatus Nitrotoga sp.]MDP1855432.1 hypothetical protein [Candidatus Nitrotoga sp.]